MKKNYTERVTIILVSLFLWIGYIVSFAYSKPMHTTTDELGAMVSAAKIAGLNWSGVIDCCGYYGFGWYSLFFWIFYVTDSPFVIYRTIIIGTALLRACVFPIALHITQNYVGVKSTKKAYCYSIFATVLGPTTLGIVSNEYPLELVFWLILLVECKTFESKGKVNTQYSFLLILLLIYSMFLHTRALTIVIAVVLVATLVTIKNKKPAIHPSAIFVFCVLFVVARKLISLYQNSIWISETEVRNTSVTVSKGFSIFDKNVWKIWIDIIIGNFTTEGILTGGVFVLAVAIALYFTISALSKSYPVFQYNSSLAIVLYTSALCMATTIMALCVSPWFKGMLDTWDSLNVGSQYAYKGLSYVRYWNVYTPPFIYATVMLAENCKKRRPFFYLYILMFVLVLVIYGKEILPLIENNRDSAGFLYPVGGYDEGHAINKDFYLYAICISFAVMLLFSFLYYTKRTIGALALISFFLFFNQFKASIQYNNVIKEKVYLMVDSSYELKEVLEKSGINVGNFYLADISNDTDGNWKIYAACQFYFNRYPMNLLPEDGTINTGDIIIANGLMNSVLTANTGIHYYILDDNEVWYTYLDINDCVAKVQ